MNDGLRKGSAKLRPGISNTNKLKQAFSMRKPVLIKMINSETASIFATFSITKCILRTKNNLFDMI